MNNDECRALVLRWHALVRAIQEASQRRKQRMGTAPEVALLAVSKRQPIDKLFALYDLGQRDFAENYVQELAHKDALMRASGRAPRWHLIGPLQRNKVRTAMRAGATVHTIDSIALATKLATLMDAIKSPVEVLVQVRFGADVKKAGVTKDQLEQLVQNVLALPQLRLVGLMAMAQNINTARADFIQLRQLSEMLRQRACHSAAALGPQLCMGMSDDFSLAIDEGATMVRVGTALFGPRQ